MLAILEEKTSSQDSPLVRLGSWPENSHGLVSWWQIMMFDAGRLSSFVNALSTIQKLEGIDQPCLFKDLGQDGQSNIREIVGNAIKYCDEMPLPMAVIPLRRLADLFDDPYLDSVVVSRLVADALGRVVDEAKGIALVRLPCGDDTDSIFKTPRLHRQAEGNCHSRGCT